MKTLHHLDFPIQMIILGLTILCLFFSPGLSFIGFYIGLGCWQPLMALVFAIGPRPHAVQGRTHYEIALLTITLVTVLWSLIGEQIGIDNNHYLYFMLVVGFFMALWNMSIAYRELQLAKSEHEVWDLE